MKKRFSLFLFAILFLFSWTARGQEVTLQDVSARGYDGVKSLDGKAFYTFYFGEKTENKMANFILELFDQDLNKINSTQLELKKGSELAGSCFNGKNFLFVFVDWARKTRTMVTLDSKGRIIEQKEETDVKRNLLNADNYSNILASSGDFILVRPEKEKKYGFSVDRIDEHLNVKWTKSYIDDDHANFIMLSQSKNDKIYLLRQEKPNRTADKFTDYVICLDPANGNELFSYSLNDGESTAWPSALVIDDKGVVTTAGMYFNGQKFDDVNSDGLFFLALDASGKKSAYNKTPWKNIIDKIKDENSGLLMGGKTKTLVQDIVQKKDGSYMVIAETWRKSNNANNAGDLGMKALGGFAGTKSTNTSSSSEKQIGFTVMDFIFFSYNTGGELSDIKKVKKEPRSITITGDLVNSTGLEIAMEMKKEGFFTYQYTIENNNIPYVVYRDYDGFKQKAYFLPMDATDTKNIASIDMNKEVNEKLNKVAKGLSALSPDNQLEYNSSLPPWERGLSMKWKGIVRAKPGNMLLYDYVNGKLHIWMVKIPG